MIYKLIGAGMIVSCCAGCGLSVTLYQKSEMKMLDEFRHFLNTILCELPYKLTPLPELILSGASNMDSRIKQLLEAFSIQLERKVFPDASCCMCSVLNEFKIDSESIKNILIQFGNSLGRFDLEGQIKELTGLQEQCKDTLFEMKIDHEKRFQSYRVLGVSAGIALVILLI